MATVIDSLVLELGLDPTKFTTVQRETLASLRQFERDSIRYARNIETQNDRVVDVFKRLKKEVLGVTALFLGGMGIKEFVNHITNLDAATGRAAKTLDLSAQELSAWQGAAQATGGTAAGITGTMQALSTSLNQMAFGVIPGSLSAFSRLGISVVDANGKIKNSAQLMLELARQIRQFSSDPAQQRAFLQLIPGMNEDSINLILRGEGALRQLLGDMREAGGTTDAAAAAAQRYQENLVKLERSSQNLGRTLFNMVAPALARVADEMAKFLQGAPQPGTPLPHSGFGAPSGKLNLLDAIRTGRVGEWWNGPSAGDDAKGRLAAALNARTAGGAGGDHEAYIRAAAAARGIDPNIAVQVARSEGLGGSYAGDRGSSFGDFQLHYGGMAGGGMAVGGLGDQFTKSTGLDARDPSTWKAQADFALDQAAAHGWGAWHGWRGSAWAGITPGAGAAAAAGSAGSSTVTNRGGDTNSVHIGSMTVTAPGGSSDDIAGGMSSSIRRSMPGMFNGQE